jgi:small subunit ribosomal protein S1
MKKLLPGEEINAAIVQISDDTIFLDLNSKSEGVLNAAELKDENGNLSVKEGDVIKAYFLDDKNGEMRFTTKIASNNVDKTIIENAYKNGIPVEGKVEKEIKGGYEVKIGNIRAFCPFSQMGGRRKEENETFEGKTLIFKITEYKNDGRNVLVSNRAVLEAARLSQMETLKSKLKVGMTVSGKVLSLQPFGAFVDVQGFQALLPVSEISRGRV